MSRHRNTRCAAIEDDLGAARGDYDDDYLDEYDDDDERRIDPEDGCAYTLKEFVECYGGQKEWDKARPEFEEAEPTVALNLAVKKDFHSQITGKTAKDIEKQHKVQLFVPPSSAPSNLIKISGTQKAAAAAKEALEKEVALLEQRFSLKETGRDSRSGGLAWSEKVLEQWPTLDTQKLLTVTYDIEKGAHAKIEDNVKEINKRFNYGKAEPAVYHKDGSLVGDTFVTVPSKFTPSTLICISGPSHKVQSAVTTFNGFLNFYKLMGMVQKVTRSDQEEKKPKKEKKARKEEKEKTPNRDNDKEPTPAHVPRGVAGGGAAAAAAGRGDPMGRGEGVPAGRGEGVPAGRGEGVSAGRGEAVPAGRGEGVPAGRGEGVSAGRGEGVSAGRGEAVPAGRGEGVPAGRGEGVSAGRGEGASAGRGAGVPDGRGETAPSENASVPPATGQMPAKRSPTGQGVLDEASTATPDASPPLARGPQTEGRGAVPAARGRGVGIDLSARGRGRGVPVAPRPTQRDATPEETHEVLEQRTRRRHAS